MGISKIIMTDTTFQLEGGKTKRVIKKDKDGVPEYELFLSDECGRQLEYLYKYGEEYISVKECEYDKETNISNSKVIIANKEITISADVQLYTNTRKYVVKEIDNISGLIVNFIYDPKNGVCSITSKHHGEVIGHLDDKDRIFELLTTDYYYQKIFTNAGTCAGVLDLKNNTIVHSIEFDKIVSIFNKYITRYRRD